MNNWIGTFIYISIFIFIIEFTFAFFMILIWALTDNITLSWSDNHFGLYPFAEFFFFNSRFFIAIMLSNWFDYWFDLAILNNQTSLLSNIIKSCSINFEHILPLYLLCFYIRLLLLIYLSKIIHELTIVITLLSHYCILLVYWIV
jgi:hypothetical protein